jgi:hypothetical protein
LGGNNASLTQIQVNSGGELTATGSTFNLNKVTLNAGSADTIQLTFFATQLTINSGASIGIHSDNFSSASATVVAAGISTATIDLTNNFWGTLNTTQIAAKITDHNKNSSLPTVLYQPFLTENATGTYAANASAIYSPSAQTVNLTASVIAAGQTVNEGAATFTILSGGTTIGSPVTVNVVNGAATAPYGLPPAAAGGTYTIQAVYNGDSNFLGSSDSSHSLTISSVATTTAAASVTTTYSAASQSVSLSAVVTSAVGTVNEGSVTFTILSGGNPIGSAVSASVSSGSATASYSLPAGTSGGTYTIQAVYNGTADYGSSSEASQSLTINPAASQTALQSSNNPSYFGVPATFTATVSSSTPGPVTPTGQVEFFDGSTLLDTATLSGGTASYTTSSLSVGTNQPIEAEYLGDSNFSPSNLTIQQTVKPTPPSDTWISTASGDWSVGSNWSTGAAPTSNEAVVINVSGATPTVTISSGSQSVLYITASDPLSITGGSLTVAAYSTISDGLSMTGGSLVASGADASLTVTGTTAFSGGSLTASAGGTLSLPNLTSFSAPGSATLQATGSGSALDLPNLTSVTNTYFADTIQASSGGTVNLITLTTLAADVSFVVQGKGSTLNIPDLTSFSDGNSSWGASLLAESGAAVEAGALTTLNGVTVTVSDTATMPLSQITNINSSSFIAEGGASVSLPGVTSYSASGNANLEAANGESVLSFPN